MLSHFLERLISSAIKQHLIWRLIVNIGFQFVSEQLLEVG